MHPESEHGLRVQLATALRERDEARERARVAEAAWAKAKFRALPEYAQDTMDAVLARADVAESQIDVSEKRRDAAESALAAANARADAAEAELRWYQTTDFAEALAAARRECEGLREAIAALLPMAERAHHADLGKHLCPDIGSLPEGLRIAREGALLLRLHHPDIASPTERSDVDVAQTALARLIAVLDSPFVNVEATATTAAELTEAMSQARAALTGGWEGK